MAIVTLDGLSPERLAELAGSFTSLEEGVYFASEHANLRKLAAATARLSRSDGDLRRTYANEFLGEDGAEEDFVERILFAYGDDSVAQLYPMVAFTEGISNLATKKVEMPRLMSYLEQSTRYIRYDVKDEHGRYPFFTPPELCEEDARLYETKMAQIFDQYSLAVGKIEDYLHSILEKPTDLRPGQWRSTLRAQACDATRSLLPAAVQSTVGIVGSAQAFENLMYKLGSDRLTEMRDIGDHMLLGARMVAPEYFKRVDLADRGNMTKMYLGSTEMAIDEWSKELGLDGPDDVKGESVDLVDFRPEDELDIVKNILFDASGMSMSAIEKVLKMRSDNELANILRDYIGNRQNRRHKPGRAFEHPHYTWEFVTDYGIFRDLQRHRMVDDLRWQNLKVSHGHLDVPEVAIQAGVAECFENAYKTSEELHGLLSNKYGEEVAQYATLLGHMMRWSMTINAREAYHIHELRTSSQGHPGYRRVVNRMHDKVEKVHPIISKGMKFVDRGENPQLARLDEALRNAAKARATGKQ